MRALYLVRALMRPGQAVLCSSSDVTNRVTPLSRADTVPQRPATHATAYSVIL